MFDLSNVKASLEMAAKDAGVSVAEVAAVMIKEISDAIVAGGCVNGVNWLLSDQAQNLYDLKNEIENQGEKI